MQDTELSEKERHPLVRCFYIALLSMGIMSVTSCAVSKMAPSSTPLPSAGQVSLSPSTISFGSVTIGANKSQAGSLTAGSSGITVSSASWNGTGYSLSGITFPLAIPAGQSVPFTVTFAPQQVGSATGSISFLSDAANSPTIQKWSATGAAQTTPRSVALDWNPETAPLLGYFVYRGTQTGGPYSKISPLQPGPPYTDLSVSSGQTYYYVVTALDNNSVESSFSNEATAVIP